MLQFLQTYGVWILLGAFFILMMRMHGGAHGGAGCGMGGQNELPRENEESGTSETRAARAGGSKQGGGSCH